MTEDNGFYTFLGKLDAFNGQYICGVKGIMRLLDKMGLQREQEYRVLEVGAATGFISRIVAKEYGCHVTSSDISEELVEKSRLRADVFGLSNMEFKVGDAMNLDFLDESFNAVYSVGTTGILPDTHRALSEYVRVLKKGGVVGGIDLLLRDEVPPEAGEAINIAMEKMVGAGTRVRRLVEWRRLLDETGLVEIEVEPHYDVVFEKQGFGLDTIGTYLKLVYYLVSDSWFRSLFFEVMELRKVVSETSGDVFNNMGYLVYTGRKGM